MKYVAPFDLKYKTKHGTAIVPKGFITDGATGVFDLEPEAWFLHDLGYLIGGLIIDGSLNVTSKIYLDWLYAKVLTRNHRPVRGFVRFCGLQSPISWYLWRKHRKSDQTPWQKRVYDGSIVDPDGWEYDMQTWLLKDAKKLSSDRCVV